MRNSSGILSRSTAWGGRGENPEYKTANGEEGQARGGGVISRKRSAVHNSAKGG